MLSTGRNRNQKDDPKVKKYLWVISTAEYLSDISDFLFQFLQKRSHAHTVIDELVQILNLHPFLGHGIAVAHCHAMVVERIVVNSNAERGAYGILTAVSLADAVLLVILAIEVIFQFIHDGLGKLWKHVFLAVHP